MFNTRTDPDENPYALPRMTLWLLLSIALFVSALIVADTWPGSIAAVTLHKAHLMSLGGWGGYWLDRGLFPYARPHTMLGHEFVDEVQIEDGQSVDVGWLQATESHWAMLRRAVIVAACLICVGLGA